MTVRLVDEKDDEPQWLVVFFCVDEIGAGKLKGPSIGSVRAEVLENAHNCYVVQSATCVLSMCNL